MRNDEHHRINHAWWEERAILHPGTDMYRESIAELREGRDPLKDLEVREVGDVRGKTLLHLQCHIGTDTLGWARRGAEVTGVDYSRAALTRAEALAQELGLRATFVHCDIRDLAARLSGPFDIVFTSYGAISWLDDLATWAVNIERLLAPGGFFYIADCHPMLFTMSEEAGRRGLLEAAYPYFEQPDPIPFEGTGSYADPDARTQENATREWSHGLSEVVMPLLRAGLILEFLHEHRECPWPALPCCLHTRRHQYVLPEKLRDRLPLIFSLKARKPSPGEGYQSPSSASFQRPR